MTAQIAKLLPANMERIAARLTRYVDYARYMGRVWILREPEEPKQNRKRGPYNKKTNPFHLGNKYRYKRG